MASESKSEAEIYKELYEKVQKENERLKINAAKATSAANRSATEMILPVSPAVGINTSDELMSLKNEMAALKQAMSATIQQLNAYGMEQEKIRTQVRTNHQNISQIVNLINGGK